VFLLSRSNFSQTHQIYFSAGYNIPTTTAVLGNFQSNNSYKQYISTYSEGIAYQGGYQFGITNNFAIDLNFNYLPGFKNEKYFVASDGGYSSYTNSNISISPSINIKLDIGNFSPYTKFGFSVSFIKLDGEYKYVDNFDIIFSEYSYKGNIALGFVGGIGVNYLFDQSFIGFLEAQLNSITYYPSELQLTQIFRDGTKNTTIFQLQESLDQTSSENIIPSQDFPFSSFGLIIGLRIVL